MIGTVLTVLLLAVAFAGVIFSLVRPRDEDRPAVVESRRGLERRRRSGR